MVFRRQRQMCIRDRYSGIGGFQGNLVEGKPNDWRCRAGARYIYICEEGLVHYCSQQRGYPGIPIQDYNLEDIRREYLTEKSCAPYCTISCVHQASMADSWRHPQTITQTKKKSKGLVNLKGRIE